MAEGWMDADHFIDDRTVHAVVRAAGVGAKLGRVRESNRSVRGSGTWPTEG
jgi:hypothetical protein